MLRNAAYYKNKQGASTEYKRESGLTIDCKTVVFFANASDGVGPSSNERSGASVKTARENGERR